MLGEIFCSPAKLKQLSIQVNPSQNRWKASHIPGFGALQLLWLCPALGMGANPPLGWALCPHLAAGMCWLPLKQNHRLSTQQATRMPHTMWAGHPRGIYTTASYMWFPSCNPPAEKVSQSLPSSPRRAAHWNRLWWTEIPGKNCSFYLHMHALMTPQPPAVLVAIKLQHQ